MSATISVEIITTNRGQSHASVMMRNSESRSENAGDLPPHAERDTFVYQGEEIGMTNCPLESIEEFRNEATTRQIEVAKKAGRIEAYQQIRDQVGYWSRDNAPTLMQWSDEKHTGFTDGEP